MENDLDSSTFPFITHVFKKILNAAKPPDRAIRRLTRRNIGCNRWKQIKANKIISSN